jgi:hypothetical protein
MRKTAALLGAGALVAAGAALALPASAADDAQVSVLHGIPANVLEAAGIAGGVVDVYVNGTNTIDDFKPGELKGPLPLAAGTYSVAITAGNAADASSPALGPIDVTVSAGKNYTITANLKADGTPGANVFENDTAAAPAGQGKVTVRHIAANAEGVEVVASGTSLGTFNNGGTLGPATLPAGTINAEVKAGGTVVAASPVPVTAAKNTIVYAWGDPAANPSTFAFAVQTVDLAHSAPSGVPGGESGSAASTVPGWVFAAAGLGLAGAALSSRKLAVAKK